MSEVNATEQICKNQIKMCQKVCVLTVLYSKDNVSEVKESLLLR